ncbi:hypothetical protein PRIPAC_77804 [Pristionchus pacificus]|uniref:Hydrolase n=1 Tax=Pristionchus pacificus TaxID=54126 RepID=A0A454XQK4_PRIPA|nr:hypothetical protein PRIPAC_77804 [Pristionchus pacificus]|eukprot:PDM72503.1 hydrolase [Pristionchus pacificus]
MSEHPVPVLSQEDVFNYDAYLFDADGTLWTHDEPIPGAIKFVQELISRNKKVFIITNNSSRSTRRYLQKVTRLGFPVEEKNIISPNTIIIDFCKRNPHFIRKGIYLIGNIGSKEALEEALDVECFGIGHDPMPDAAGEGFPSTITLEKEASCVVVGDDPHFSYLKLIKATNFLADPNCGFFIANEDATLPNDTYILPGTGCFAAALRTAVLPREPVLFGKPGEPMGRYLKNNLELNPEKTIMFGDRLDTDIKFGSVNGFDTCWVRTGTHSVNDVNRAIDGDDKSLVPMFTFSFTDVQ